MAVQVGVAMAGRREKEASYATCGGDDEQERKGTGAVWVGHGRWGGW